MRVETETLADGVYLLAGGTHNSIAVEFATFIAVFDAPLSEARSLAVIEEIVRQIPNKPIRFVINSHQHFDHTGGLRAYNHIGATVITHWKNFDFLNRDVINYVPRTLRPDMVSLWPPTELAEGYYFETGRENYVHHRRRAHDADSLREPAAARRRHADGVSPARAAAPRGGSGGHVRATARARSPVTSAASSTPYRS